MIRKANREDIVCIRTIYEIAKQFMRNHGNFSQWINGYPSDELIRNDIQNNNLYVCYDENGIYGVFAFIVGDDPTYRVIDGHWLDDNRYGTIHRIASNQTRKGVLNEVVDYCYSIIKHLRIDTHEVNIIMQEAITKCGFKKCGIITIADGTPRIAYELSAKV